MAYPKNYRYTKEHEWINVEGGLATIGITDYAQHELGDVVFVELPKPGAKIETGKSFGTVESVKAVSEIYAPVAGEVIEANGELQNTPEKINTDPHGAAWLIKVRLTNAAELSGLMDAAAYEAYATSRRAPPSGRRCLPPSTPNPSTNCFPAFPNVFACEKH